MKTINLFVLISTFLLVACGSTKNETDKPIPNKKIEHSFDRYWVQYNSAPKLLCAPSPVTSGESAYDIANDEETVLNFVNKLSESQFPGWPIQLDCGLTLAEGYAIQLFLYAYYSVFNNVLRGKKGIPESWSLIRTLQRALLKFQPYEAFVRRGTDLPQEIVDKMDQPDGEFSDPGFMSTSRTEGWLNRDYRFLLKVKSCYYVKRFSLWTSEEEVLCAPGIQFLVLHRSTEIPKGWANKALYILEEI